MHDRSFRGGLFILLLLSGAAAFAQDAQDFARSADASNAYEIETSKLTLGAS